MAVTSSIKKIHEFIKKYQKESDLLTNDDALIALIYLGRHEGISETDFHKKLKKHVAQLKKIADSLASDGFISRRNNSIYLSPKGKYIVDIISYSKFKVEDVPEDIISGYILKKPPIGFGSTSITFKAQKKKIKNLVVKIFKPGIFDAVGLDKQMVLLEPLRKLTNLILPRDYGTFTWKGNEFKYIVMDFIEGKTLKEFLKERVAIDLRKFIENFIKEVGGTLKEVEEADLIHGDLHSNNILVVEDALHKGEGIYHFQIIDFIGVGLKKEFSEFAVTDFEYFKQHLLKVVRLYASTPAKKPDLKMLGQKYFHLVQEMQKRINSFGNLFKALSERLPPSPELGKVIHPPFSVIRFEQYDINDPLWLQRFEPSPALYAPIRQFDNTICSGPRGCGKTIYLRSLSFVPELIKLIHEKTAKYSLLKHKIAYYSNIFGIYFACRQGEFKYFSNRYFKFSSKLQLLIKHIIALRIIRKTFHLIDQAYLSGVFSSEPKLDIVINTLTKYLTRNIMMTSDAKNRPFEQLANIVNAEENMCGDQLELGYEKRHLSITNMLNEHTLIDLLKTLQNAVSELSNIKFYIIFDDVSDPQVPYECQKILNSFMSCLNEIYCCKFSTEKFAFSYEDMFGKTLQPTNDYTYIDLSFMGTAQDRYKEKTYERYLAKIINKRLEISETKQKIEKLMGNLPYSAQFLIDLLSDSAKGHRKVNKKIVFAGWNMIVQLSSRSVRDALAICDSIFREWCDADSISKRLNRKRARIPVEIQDRAIRKHSREEYKGLLNIANYGKEIFNIVRNFGEISRQRLTQQIAKGRRKYEVITIEKTDSEELKKKAKEIFRALIRYSVFLDRGLSFSWEEIGLVQKITLHKKFTPALLTTYREREHLRISTRKLEHFILNPDEFRQEYLGGKFMDKKQLDLSFPR